MSIFPESDDLMMFSFAHERHLRPFTPAQPALQRAPALQGVARCACGKPLGSSGECAECRKKREQSAHLQRATAEAPQPTASHNFGRMSVVAPVAAPMHLDGLDDETTLDAPIREAPSPESGVETPAPDPLQAPSPTPPPAATPCPTSVSVGALAQRNHGDLPATEKETWRTWLGAMSRMDVGPGPDHSNHCMKESLTTVSNSCPASMYTRGGVTSSPCSGTACLPINRYGSMWGLTDGPTSFFDMHRTRAHESLLEGTGVNSCSVVCEQTYTCDRTQATTGTFRITRSFQAGTYTRPSDGAVLHITTGTVTKT